MGKHSLLAPSSASRWLRCTASPRLEAQVEDRQTDFTQEGTLAHAIAASHLKTALSQDITAELSEIEALKQYRTGEMAEYTETYVSIVLERYANALRRVFDSRLMIETTLDLSAYIPEAKGTADAIIISDDLMEIVDLKYGKGVSVSAEGNPQMMIYALGALNLYENEYDIRRIRMTIVQPRLDNLSEYELPAEELKRWAEEELKPKAIEAYEGGGTPVPGGWCRFCKVRNCCRALAEHCMGALTDPALLSPEEIARDILPKIPAIKTWASGIEEYALGQALKGVALPGYKLVHGRSIRRITDEKEAGAALESAGFAADAIWKPRELQTLTVLEKVVGKKAFAQICADFIIKPEGKPTLVPDSDKRPAIDPVAEDFKDVKI